MSTPASKAAHWSKLMLKAQSGDELAYAELLQSISASLRGFLAKRISDPQTVEDILQEVLMGIHKARHTYDPERPFAAWMFAIARYKLTDYFRRSTNKNSRTVSIDDVDPEALQVEVQGIGNPDLDIRKLAEKLPEKQRQVFWGLKIDGLSIKELAQKMQISESAVKVNAHRAYQKLRRSIEELEI